VCQHPHPERRGKKGNRGKDAGGAGRARHRPRRGSRRGEDRNDKGRHDGPSGLTGSWRSQTRRGALRTRCSSPEDDNDRRAGANCFLEKKRKKCLPKKAGPANSSISVGACPKDALAFSFTGDIRRDARQPRGSPSQNTCVCRARSLSTTQLAPGVLIAPHGPCATHSFSPRRRPRPRAAAGLHRGAAARVARRTSRPG
jgi:hypothetical protein